MNNIEHMLLNRYEIYKKYIEQKEKEMHNEHRKKPKNQSNINELKHIIKIFLVLNIKLSKILIYNKDIEKLTNMYINDADYNNLLELFNIMNYYKMNDSYCHTKLFLCLTNTNKIKEMEHHFNLIKNKTGFIYSKLGICYKHNKLDNLAIKSFKFASDNSYILSNYFLSTWYLYKNDKMTAIKYLLKIFSYFNNYSTKALALEVLFQIKKFDLIIKLIDCETQKRKSITSNKRCYERFLIVCELIKFLIEIDTSNFENAKKIIIKLYTNMLITNNKIKNTPNEIIMSLLEKKIEISKKQKFRHLYIHADIYIWFWYSLIFNKNDIYKSTSLIVRCNIDKFVRIIEKRFMKLEDINVNKIF